MTAGYFITGTDTSVGKTRASCALLHTFAAHGKQVVGMKPLVAGSENGKWLDIELLLAASNVAVSQAQINPYAFIPPIAPHIAAKQVGIEIDLKVIQQAYFELQEIADMVVVEGVGGFLVPLSGQADGADLARILNLPVILVVGLRLGCLNHALLTAQAIRVSGRKLVGWIANSIDPVMLEQEQNIDTLKQRLDCPLLGRILFEQDVDTKNLAKCLDVTKLV